MPNRRKRSNNSSATAMFLKALCKRKENAITLTGRKAKGKRMKQAAQDDSRGDEKHIICLELHF